MEFKYIDLRHELQETLELLRSSIPHMIKIEDSYDADSYECFGDFDQIHQVLMNIGMNAAQAIGEHNGTINFNLTSFNVQDGSELMLRYEIPEGPYVKLSVIDNGPGIPSKYLDEIFDPFFTTKTQTDGSGLGLSVVMRIATNHGGIALAEKCETGGACISVYLPLSIKRVLS